MNGDERDILREVHDLQLQQAKSTAHIKERLNVLDERQSRMETNVNVAFAALKEDGQRLAAIDQRCENHREDTRELGRKQSDLFAKLNVSDHTGKVHIAKVTQTWKTVAIVASVLMGAAGIAMAIWKALS